MKSGDEQKKQILLFPVEPQLNCKLYDYCILILFLLCVWLLLFRVKEE